MNRPDPCFCLWRRKKKPDVCLWPPGGLWGSALWPRRRSEHFSPLTLRILAVNVMALVILVGSLLYLGRYKDRLIATELDGLMMQARLSASAVAEGAVVLDAREQNILSPLLARLMIRRLVEASETRTRLYDNEDMLVADSQILLDAAEKVQVRRLARRSGFSLGRMAMGFFDTWDRYFSSRKIETYPEDDIREGAQREIIRRAQGGEAVAQVWHLPDGGLLLSIAVPVQRYKQVLGTVLLTRPDTKISASIRLVRIDILKIFGATMLITFLLSLYLAHTITNPIKQLAKAAEGVRSGQRQTDGLSGAARFLGPDAIPDFSDRYDEIGDLSVALREMTAALAKRIGAIENFAADVAHEIKNPLTSLRSAVETVQKVSDPERQKKLLQVIYDDAVRLDRLISDISNASRLDAELTRDEAVPLDLTQMLRTLVDFYTLSPERKTERAAVVLSSDTEEGLKVMGVEVRLVQVIQNLVANALSFAPSGTEVRVTARSTGAGEAEILVEDEGGGIPENKLDAIFDRFYSQRPKAEKFGTHSGLGLSISKQIVEAHRGRIWAENRKNEAGDVIGARFVVRVPGIQ